MIIAGGGESCAGATWGECARTVLLRNVRNDRRQRDAPATECGRVGAAKRGATGRGAVGRGGQQETCGTPETTNVICTKTIDAMSQHLLLIALLPSAAAWTLRAR